MNTCDIRAGLQFENWTVLRSRIFISEKTNSRRKQWRCRCACGREQWIEPNNLIRRFTTQCRSCAAAKGPARTHGMSLSPEYRTHRAMLNRCYNPNVVRFPRYGGRGIKVCQGWKGPEGFKHFLADMGLRPPSLTLDRKNNDGMYSCGHCVECKQNRWPANCRWATRSQQTTNQTRPIKSNAERKDVPTATLINLYVNQNLSSIDVSKRLRISSTAVIRRLRNAGIPIRPLGTNQFSEKHPGPVRVSQSEEVHEKAS